MALTIPNEGGDVTIEGPGGIPTGSFTSGLGNTILGNTLNAAFVLAAILVLFYMIWAGIQWIMSGGDKQKIAAARNRIIYSVVGLLIIALAIPIVNFFLTFFNAPLLRS
ncbi:MAG: hypothetical protein RLZZ455_562 [Candidatus Parcubacteria bacterium]|jgi:hypothetical protein